MQADIGLIGLAVMGENLVLNMESHGFTVAVFNRTTSKVDEFVDGRRPRARRSSAPHTVEGARRVAQAAAQGHDHGQGRAGRSTTSSTSSPPLLEPGDILIDGGNTHFPDTTRRDEGAEGARAPLHRHGRLGRRGGRAARARRSCPAATPRPGRASSRSSRPSPPRSTTARPAATGSAPRAPATTSRWSTTASSTATCSSSARPTTS